MSGWLCLRSLMLKKKILDLRENASGEQQAANLELAQECLREAEECLEELPRVDDGWTGDSRLMTADKLERRRKAGLPTEPEPSAAKLQVWSTLFVARQHVALTLEGLERHEAAVPVYRALIDQAFTMRSEVWEDDATAHVMMNQLGLCYQNCGKLEEATEWFRKGLALSERESPSGSDTQEQLRTNLKTLNFLYTFKAGPALDGGTGRGGGGEEGDKKLWKKCWTCGVINSANCKLMRCSKCHQLKIATPAYYCSVVCQKEDWERHKKYHTHQKGNLKSGISTLKDEDRAIMSDPNFKPESEYHELVTEGQRRQEAGDLKKARRLYQKAAELDPERPYAHFNLACVYHQSGEFSSSINGFSKTMRMADASGQYSDLWARSAATIFAAFQIYGSACPLSLKPDWMCNPDRLLAVAERAVQWEPTYNETWGMLGSAHEQKENYSRAGECYERAVQVSEAEWNMQRFRLKAERVAQLSS